MEIVITGNRQKGLASILVPQLEARGHHCFCLSRETGYDFEAPGFYAKVIKQVKNCDVFINMSAGYHFKAAVLAQKVYQSWCDGEDANKKQMINIGSTTDRVKKGKSQLYHYEKQALREISNGLALLGVWDQKPKVSYLSFGTMENRQEQHKDRRCLTFQEVTEAILWVLERPSHLAINELSLDPIQP